MKRTALTSSGFALLLAACASNPQQLPVGVSGCHATPNAQTFVVVARVDSNADRPISHLDMTITFYQDFRYRSFTGSAQLRQELDPGQHQDVTFQISNAGGPAMRGQAMRCLVTRIGYLDGTSQSAPRNQF
jgi:hypothetical protein